jgi:uncharacterized protein YkwD
VLVTSRPKKARSLKGACEASDTRGVIDLRKLIASASAILVCASAGAGAVLDTAAASAHSPARAHSTAKRHSAHSACEASASRRRHGKKGRVACRSHKTRHNESHAARNRSGQHTNTGHHSKKNTSRTSTETISLSPENSQSLASILATPCQNTELTPEAGNLEAIDAATLCLVNQERARHGEQPLQPNGQLAEAAQGHSEEMVSEDYFAHVAPSGETPVGRVEATGYLPNQQVGYTLGENIAWGTLGLSTPSAIVAAWIASPEHLANILYSPYRDTAIGVAPEAPASLAEGQQGAVYSQEFGVIVA